MQKMRKKERSTGRFQPSHGMSNTPTHRSWLAMINRCINKNARNFQWYGGKGVTVCARWLDFSKFYEDMGDRPEGTSLDRIDSTGNYEPSNCKWSTAKQQNNNRTDNKWITIHGETRTVTGWAKELGISVGTLHCRLRRGMPLHKALTNKDHRCKNQIL